MSSNEPYASSSSVDRQDQSMHERVPLLSEAQGSGSRKNKGKAAIPTQHYAATSQTESDIPEIHSSRRSRRSNICFWLSIVSTIIAVTVIMLLLFAPNMAQRYFRDGVEVYFDEASILNISDGDSLDIHVTGKLTLNDKLYGVARKAAALFGDISTEPSSLDVFNAADRKSQSALGTIELPDIMVNRTNSTTIFSFVTPFHIGDTEQLAAFCREAVQQKEVVWKVKGPVGASVGWFPKGVSIDIEKDVTLEGMDGLKQAELKSMVFFGEHPRGGINIAGQVSIYNPSSTLSFKLGDVDFGIHAPIANSSKDALIAIVRAKDAELLGKKDNMFNVTGRSIPIDPNDTERQQAVEQFLSDYLQGKTTTVNVRGSDRGPDNDENPHLPNWMKNALGSVTLNIPFPGSNQTDFIENLALKNISIDFAAETGTVVSGSAVALMKPPPEMQFDIDVQEIQPLVYLYLTKDHKKPFAKLAPTEASPATTILPKDDPSLPDNLFKVESKLDRAPLTVLPGGEGDFEKFLNKTFYGSEHKVYIGGTVKAAVVCAFGHLTIKDISFNGEISTKGMSGLLDPPPRLDSIDINHGFADGLFVLTNISLFNPSDVTVSLGEVSTYILYEDIPIGNSTLANHVIVPGWNKILAEAFFAPSQSGSHEKAMEFLSRYASGDNETQLQISGNHPNASKSPELQSMLRNFRFNSSAPLMNQTLLIATQMNIFSSTAELWLMNPFNGTTIEVLAVNATACYEGHKIGSVHADFEDLSQGWTRRLILPSNGSVVHTEKLPVMFEVGAGFEAIRKAVGKSIAVDVDSVIRARIDDLHIDDLLYHKQNVSARVRLFQ